MNKLTSEFESFFTNEPGASGGTQLFKQELRFYEKQEKEDTAEGAQALSEIKHKIFDALALMNAHTIPCLEDYRKESKKTIVFNRQKLKVDAPYVVEFLDASGCLFK